MDTTEAKADRYSELLKNKPTAGEILTTKNNKQIFVKKNMKETDIAFVLNIAVDNEGTGWYISERENGLKALLIENVDAEKYESFVKKGELPVSRVEVLRQTKSGKALLCKYIK